MTSNAAAFPPPLFLSPALTTQRHCNVTQLYATTYLAMFWVRPIKATSPLK